MKINRNLSFLSALVLATGLATISVGQVPETWSITSAIAQVIQGDEPEWHFTPGHCTCPPLVSPLEKSSMGLWERRDLSGQREQVMVEIYAIPSNQEAVDAMKAWADKVREKSPSKSRNDSTESSDCVIEKQQLGDDSYLSDCSALRLDPNTSYIGGPFSIWVRKNNFLISVSARTKETAMRFATSTLNGLPSN